MSSNIEKFNEVVAQIFGVLYSKFPVRICLAPYEIMGYESRGHYSANGEWKEELKVEDGEYFYYTLRWLYDTGYIVGSISHTHDTNVTLSHKGLELLKSVPKSVDTSKSIGDQLQEAIKDGAKNSAGNLISSALSTNNVMSIFSSVFG